ncbi:DUF3238 domain-containing protein [Paenibacillus sp. H1-7]|uniref:DUF3238 domain-containing protein n=1 Tax=Paenibacillus sp. H1-7 TaxID=2282849 RepID=UPI001EF8C74E|nr:DUF3238 domain-containing protein [Paenibacillus sp. H1-7]ULL18040.1 DUF3238 domain-containing protein [Paenibacillus sp. H1-7]
MVTIVKLRACVFIGELHWLQPIYDPTNGNCLEFAGDIRGFTPHAVNTGRSRVEQEVTIDFVKRRLVPFACTGETILKITGSDGTVSYRQERASTEGIIVNNEQWSEDAVFFTMKSSVSNPMRRDAPAPDYILHVKVQADGKIHAKGSHDGFPCYEFYKQTDFGPFELIHSHNFHLTGDTPAAMAGEMEYHFEKTIG